MSLERKYQDLVSLRRALDSRLQALEAELRRESGDVLSQVARRKSLAQSLELDKRLLDMYRQIEHSPNWTAVATSDDEVILELFDPVAPELMLAFEHNRSSYSLRFRRRAAAAPGTDAPPYALIAFCDARGKMLVAISVMNEHDSYGRLYRLRDIEAFVPGNWIKDFLELSEEVASLKKELEIRRKYDPSELQKIKNRFGL